MTRFKQSKFTNKLKVNGNNAATPPEQGLTPANINSDLDKLTKAKEAIRWERIGLLEDSFVQSVAKEKKTTLT